MRNAISLLCLLLFFSCSNRHKADKEKDENAVDPATEAALVQYGALGDSVSMAAGAELLRNLNSAIDKSGASGALAFCNVHASPLIDSLSAVYGCEIRRISTRYRNPSNKPAYDSDYEQLAEYEKAHAAGESLQPVTYQEGEDFLYYRPIVLSMPTCLKCHGAETEIDAATQKLLKEKYPEDLATGFRLNDFRGAWRILFRKKKSA